MSAASNRLEADHAEGICRGPAAEPPCALCLEEGRKRRPEAGPRKPGGGRPRVGDRRITVRLPAAVVDAVDQHAEESKGTRSDALREALADYYDLDL